MEKMSKIEKEIFTWLLARSMKAYENKKEKVFITHDKFQTNLIISNETISHALGKFQADGLINDFKECTKKESNDPWVKAKEGWLIEYNLKSIIMNFQLISEGSSRTSSFQSLLFAVDHFLDIYPELQVNDTKQIVEKENYKFEKDEYIRWSCAVCGYYFKEFRNMKQLEKHFNIPEICRFGHRNVIELKDRKLIFRSEPINVSEAIYKRINKIDNQ